MIPKPDATEWLIMVYLDGDIEYEGMMIDALNELEAGYEYTSEITVIIMIDRSSSYDKSCGNWNGARYYRLLPDDDPMTINSELLIELGNTNMGMSSTLRNFVNYSLVNYPANKKALVLSDHGNGLSGICIDHTSNYDFLKIDEVQQAMNGFHIDLLITEACSMGYLEIAYEWSSFTDYYGSSQNAMYIESLDYEKVMIELCSNPTILPIELAEIFGQTYMETYDYTTFQTYSIINCSALIPVLESLNNLSKVLINRLPEEINEIQQLRIALSNEVQTIDFGNMINCFRSYYLSNQTILDILQELELNYNNSVLFNFNGRYVNLESIITIGYTGLNLVFFYDNESLYFWDQYVTQSDSGHLTNVDFFDDSLWDDFQRNYTAIAPIVEISEPIINPITNNQNYPLELNGKLPAIYSLEIDDYAIYNFTLTIESGDIDFYLRNPVTDSSFRTIFMSSFYINPEEGNIEQIIHWLKPGIVYIYIYSYGNSTGNLIVKYSEPTNIHLNEEISGEFPLTFQNFPPGTIHYYYSISLDEGTYEVRINSSWPVGLEVAIIDESYHDIKNELYGVPGGNFSYTLNLFSVQSITIGFGSYTGTGTYTFIIIGEQEGTTENGLFPIIIIPFSIIIIGTIKRVKKNK